MRRSAEDGTPATRHDVRVEHLPAMDYRALDIQLLEMPGQHLVQRLKVDHPNGFGLNQASPAASRSGARAQRQRSLAMGGAAWLPGLRQRG